MTRQELRDEAKDSDGRPETKQRIRQMQQQLARRRMMTKVPGADVVIVNPTHFAVALKYDPENMRAPRVLAKGVDLVALNIRRIAEEHRVPIFDSPKLARALYRSTDLDQRDPGRPVHGGRAGAVVHLPGPHAESDLAARLARPDPKVGDEYADAMNVPRRSRHFRRIRAQRPRGAGAGHGRARHDGAAAAGVPARRVLHVQHLAVADHPAGRDLRAPRARIRDAFPRCCSARRCCASD